MRENRRQISIVFELLTHNEPLDYHYFQTLFSVSQKTIREDVKTINDTLKITGMEIHLEKSRGFFLVSDKPEVISDMKEEFLYRFIDSNDIQNNLIIRVDEIMALIFSSSGYIRIADLSLQLNLNARSVSTLLKKTRALLKKYRLELVSRPHYGLSIQGREIDIRYCYMDTVCFYSKENRQLDLFSDRLELFQMSESEEQKITGYCLDFIRRHHIALNQSHIRKLIMLIMVSHRRIVGHHPVRFSEKERTELHQWAFDFDLTSLIHSLTQFYQMDTMDEDEILLLRLFILSSLDYSQPTYVQQLTPMIREDSRKWMDILNQQLIDYGIARKNTLASMESFVYPVVIQSTIRAQFQIIEHNPNAVMKKAVCNSPLSAVIGSLSFRLLQEKTGCLLGDSVAVHLSLAFYSWIRQTQNIRKMNSIAILTPDDHFSGESLKRRILDRFANIIRRIDVMSAVELMNSDLSDYNYLIQIENSTPLIIPSPIPVLKAGYYFTEEDVTNFYEYIAVPSRIYRNSFARPSRKDYIFRYHFTSVEALKKELMSELHSEALKSQLNRFVLSSRFIFNHTLSILLFTHQSADLFSRLYLLDKSHHFSGNGFNRVFVHVLKNDGDPIKLKTAEKVIRNLVTRADTEECILSEPILDFYSYYIYNRSLYLK